MNQLEVGKFIAQNRKKQNLTQEALAENLGVSNKTVSKWETGKCMPDYSVVKQLCNELNISVSELIDAKELESNNISSNNEEQILDLLRRTQELEKKKNGSYGNTLIMLGIASIAFSNTLSGSPVREFFSGLLLGASIVEMLVGVYIIGKNIK